MKTPTTIQLTRAYLRRLDQQNALATGVVILIVTMSVFWMLLHAGGDNITALYANIMYGVASLIGASFAFLTARRARSGPVQFAFSHRLAWVLISVGLLADSIGGFVFAYLAQTGTPNPEPSLSDAGFTLLYPLVFAGLLFMPTTMRFRLRTGLDAFILTLCILGISWFFAIGPTYVALKHSSPPPDPYTFVVSLSYPFWDMLLILAIVLLLLQRVERILRPSLLMIALGIISITWGDTAYAYLTANNLYQSGTFYIDPFWFAGSLLIGLASLYQYHTLAQHAFVQQSQASPRISEAKSSGGSRAARYHLLERLPQNALLYVPFVIQLALVIYLEIGGGPYAIAENTRPIRVFMILLTAVIGILIVLRYLLAAAENEVLLREREQRQQNADRLRYAAVELSNILDLEGLLEHIITLAASDLGFDAAMLMYIDEYDNPYESPNRLLVRAATTPGAVVDTWDILDNTLASHAILSGKELTATWREEQFSLPPEIADWHRRHGLKTTYFVPLTFQEKNQGCISFSCYAVSGLNRPSRTLARNYAGQVGGIIEHTRLYQRTLEREMFAQAMANIATRLNAALIEPGEVYQLICDEGAAALQADYATLYGYNSGSALYPLAVYAREEDTPAHVEDWPIIYPGDTEAQALAFLQPTIMRVDAPSEDCFFAFSLHAVQGDGPASRALIPLARAPLRQKLRELAVRRAIVAPLIAKDSVLGLLILSRVQPAHLRDKKPFSMGDLEHTQEFAEQVVVALTNALLYQGLETAHKQLQELDRLKDQFMMTASHELRTPLTSVQGYIDLLAQYGEALPPDQQQDFLQKAQCSCDELVLLLSNIMDASQLDITPHLQLAQLVPVSVRAMLNMVITIIEPHLKQERRETLVDAADDLVVLADEGRLRQILVNLSSNALKYSQPGTPVAYAARLIDGDSGSSIVISVRDWGNGIPLETRDHLFERFVRLERDLNSPVRGSGLGLYIARRLIEAMHGRIWLESSGVSGEGTTFFIQLQAA